MLLVGRSDMSSKERRASFIFLIQCIILPAIVLVIIQGNLSATCFASSVHEKKYYRGAVVEFAPDRWNQIEDPEELILRNAIRYVNIIKEAGKEKVDIIVFPEDGLTSLDIPFIRNKLISFASYIPDVKEELVICDQSDDKKFAKHLKELSCAAISNNIYVVVNLLEKKQCDYRTETDCPKDGLLMYNTNIAIDRRGKIVGKYRKFNLFKEPEMNVTSSAELVTFETDFGVRFGMFICFDILFYEPAIKTLEENNVKNIVYSTAWFSELPHLTAVGTQAGYSYSRNVNFLASGYNRPEFYNGGSGIFAGRRGPLVVVMPEVGTTKLLIANVPTSPGNTDHLNLRYQDISDCDSSSNSKCDEDELQYEKHNTKIIDFGEFDKLNKLCPSENDKCENKLIFFKEDLSAFTTESLNDNFEIVKDAKEGNFKVTKFKYNENEFSCEIIVKWKKDEETKECGPFYRLVGYSGNRSYAGVRDVRIEVCSLIACKNNELSSCGLRPDFDSENLTNITSVSIDIQSPYTSNPYVVTLNKHILPLSGDEVSFSSFPDVNNNEVKASMILEKPQNDLITFGIYKT